MLDAFLFGKLPAHGDFISRGLSARQQGAWDGGLSQAISLARAVWGGRFAERYAMAPPWRCLLSDDGTWLAGAIAPSVDRVGRLYPIVLALRGLTPDQGPLLAAGCEDLLYQAIGCGWNADILQQRASQLPDAIRHGEPPAVTEFATPVEGWWLNQATMLPHPPAALAGFMPANLLIEMIAVTEQLL